LATATIPLERNQARRDDPEIIIDRLGQGEIDRGDIGNVPASIPCCLADSLSYCLTLIAFA